MNHIAVIQSDLCCGPQIDRGRQYTAVLMICVVPADLFLFPVLLRVIASFPAQNAAAPPDSLR